MNNKTYLTIGYNSNRTHFDVIDSEDIAVAMLVRGTLHPRIERVIIDLPAGTIAEMTQARQTKITLIAPNGETLTRESGRVDAKHTLAKLRSMGVKTYNVKKGGDTVEC